MNDATEGIADLERRLRHNFRDRNLVLLALTHAGAGHGRRGSPDNERLEFLGDRVLALVIAQLLIERFPDAREGELGPRLTALVRREALAEVARKIDLGGHLVLAPADAASGARANAKLLADACEALIAALYLDGGFVAAQNFIVQYWTNLAGAVAALPLEPKTALQEWAQARGKNLPVYTVVETSGASHNPSFVIQVDVQGVEPAIATGSSKRAAEKAAALALLERLGVAAPGSAR